MKTNNQAMKTKLTILSLLLSVGVAMGQSKPGIWTIDKDTTSNRFVFFDPNKSDTTECWFKEVVIYKGTLDTIITNGVHNLNNAVQEYWQHGYIVKFPYKGFPLNRIASYRTPDNEYFLYANKKRVANPVISVIEN